MPTKKKAPAKKTTKKPAAKKSTTKKTTTKKTVAKKTTAKKKAPAKRKTAAAKSITFTFFAPEAETVSVAGTFNDWNPGKHPLKKKKDGTWSKAVKLKSGRHEYLFVINGEIWECDQNPDECSPNEFGSVNCIKHV